MVSKWLRRARTVGSTVAFEHARKLRLTSQGRWPPKSEPDDAVTEPGRRRTSPDPSSRRAAKTLIRTVRTRSIREYNFVATLLGLRAAKLVWSFRQLLFGIVQRFLILILLDLRASCFAVASVDCLSPMTARRSRTQRERPVVHLRHFRSSWLFDCRSLRRCVNAREHLTRLDLLANGRRECRERAAGDQVLLGGFHG